MELVQQHKQRWVLLLLKCWVNWWIFSLSLKTVSDSAAQTIPSLFHHLCARTENSLYACLSFALRDGGSSRAMLVPQRQCMLISGLRDPESVLRFWFHEVMQSPLDISLLSFVALFLSRHGHHTYVHQLPLISLLNINVLTLSPAPVIDCWDECTHSDSD